MRFKPRPGKRTGPPCLHAAEPYSLSVSRCEEHGTIELFVNGKSYALPEGLARNVGRALIAAADYRGEADGP